LPLPDSPGIIQCVWNISSTPASHPVDVSEALRCRWIWSPSLCVTILVCPPLAKSARFHARPVAGSRLRSALCRVARLWRRGFAATLTAFAISFCDASFCARAYRKALPHASAPAAAFCLASRCSCLLITPGNKYFRIHACRRSRSCFILLPRSFGTRNHPAAADFVTIAEFGAVKFSPRTVVALSVAPRIRFHGAALRERRAGLFVLLRRLTASLFHRLGRTGAFSLASFIVFAASPFLWPSHPLHRICPRFSEWKSLPLLSLGISFLPLAGRTSFSRLAPKHLARASKSELAAGGPLPSFWFLPHHQHGLSNWRYVLLASIGAFSTDGVGKTGSIFASALVHAAWMSCGIFIPNYIIGARSSMLSSSGHIHRLVTDRRAWECSIGQAGRKASTVERSRLIVGSCKPSRRLLDSSGIRTP